MASRPTSKVQTRGRTARTFIRGAGAPSRPPIASDPDAVKKYARWGPRASESRLVVFAASRRGCLGGGSLQGDRVPPRARTQLSQSTWKIDESRKRLGYRRLI